MCKATAIIEYGSKRSPDLLSHCVCQISVTDDDVCSALTWCVLITGQKSINTSNASLHVLQNPDLDTASCIHTIVSRKSCVKQGVDMCCQQRQMSDIVMRIGMRIGRHAHRHRHACTCFSVQLEGRPEVKSKHETSLWSHCTRFASLMYHICQNKRHTVSNHAHK